jgi:hypothetical protein
MVCKKKKEIKLYHIRTETEKYRETSTIEWVIASLNEGGSDLKF